MQIRIPPAVVRAYDDFCRWADRPIGKYLIYLDILTVLAFIPSVVWGYYSNGAWGAASGASLFVLVYLSALWLL
jgi:hypothetical protein